MKVNQPVGAYINIGRSDKRIFSAEMVTPISVSLVPSSFVLNTDLTLTSNYSSLHLNASVNQTSNSKYMFGICNYLLSGGTYDGGNAVGIYSFLQHAHYSGDGQTSIKAIHASVDCGGNALNCYGAFISAAKGNDNSLATIYGIHAVATCAYSTVTSAYGILAELRSASQATTIVEGRVFQAKWQNLSQTHTWNTLKFIALDESSKGVATVDTSYGIYADTTIDVGTTKWFIYSLSASPSRLVGDLRLNGGFRLETDSTPASAGATGTKGDIKWDSSYVYVCVDTNTWKRAAISTW